MVAFAIQKIAANALPTFARSKKAFDLRRSNESFPMPGVRV
jgi:hypothetical protein